MEGYYEAIRKCPLFYGIEDENVSAMLACVGAKWQRYPKNGTIFAEGDPAILMGIVLKGSVHVVREDYYGNRSIVAKFESSGLFGESFSCAEAEEMPVSVVAAEDTEVLLLDCHRVTKSCHNACEFHCKLVFNLMKVMAQKNLIFNEKMQITGKRTTREKLMTFLMMQAKKHHSASFEIPYNRQELADFLEVERSGLSVEISKLCKEGIIEANKKYFSILKSHI